MMQVVMLRIGYLLQKKLEFTAHGERDLWICNRSKCLRDVKVKGLIEME